MSVCSLFLRPSVSPRLLVRAMKRTSEDMLEFDSNDSSQRPIPPKKAAPGELNITIWVENLPPQCHCIRASLTLDNQGIVDDLKTQIVSRFANSRWGLCKKHFRVLQGSVHKPFYEKLHRRASTSAGVPTIICSISFRRNGFVCVWTSVAKRT